MSAVSVTYTFIDGAHFFSSNDKKWAGLCAASTNLRDAWEDVALQLKLLAEHNYGIKNVEFKPASTYEQFLTGLKAAIEVELNRLTASIEKKRIKAKTPVGRMKEKSFAGTSIPHQIQTWRNEAAAAVGC